MTPIYYENRDGEVYHIDEVSQRILVYVYLHGTADEDDLVEPAGVEDKHAVRARIRNQLGRTSTGLVEVESIQQSFGNDPDNPIQALTLTGAGESFVEKHRADLSMPVDVAKLAKRVSKLQIEDGVVEYLEERVRDLEQRVADLEDRQ